VAKAKKFTPPAAMLEVITGTKPATPVLVGAERTYYKGLKRRGYSEQQIGEFIKKAGYPVPADLWVVKAKKPVAAPTQAR
jgi:hypothetical protein